MTELVPLRSLRGMFFLSHHPWAAVLVLAIVVAVVLVQQRRR